MHGGEADILVHAAVAGDVVRVEQLVVVGCPGGCHRPRVDDPVSATGRRRRVAVMVAHRHGEMRDVVEEGMAGAHRICEVDRAGRIAFDE